jgi:outer membrane protein TolC
LNIPIWDWGVNKAQVRAAEASLRQAKYRVDNEKVDVERDIRNTVNRLQSSLKRLKLLEKTVDVAERSFEISKNRFANGDINSQSLALDRQRLSNAYNTRLSALISYKLLLADLTRKTFFDFLAQEEVTGE